ncbi:hypothetical protein AVEN_43733-1 [Araneus ventricosus]|uniref:Uncharacterized protein n=1 Tax=Araneus ventricosus TaxID=182803 RepID=A0A4Y2BVY7_ARAVE|nr:hypothetical protein AVEN_43733-1 [Araneus ventricosus]
MAVRRLANMARNLTYAEEMKRLRTLLDTVSTDEESLFDDEEEIDDDEEYNSNHDPSTDGDTDIEVDIDSSNENDFYVGRDKITTWGICGWISIPRTLGSVALPGPLPKMESTSVTGERVVECVARNRDYNASVPVPVLIIASDGLAVHLGC